MFPQHLAVVAATNNIQIEILTKVFVVRQKYIFYVHSIVIHLFSRLHPMKIKTENIDGQMFHI